MIPSAHTRSLGLSQAAFSATQPPPRQDTLTDMCASAGEWRGGYAHEGILEAAKWFEKKQKKKILKVGESRLISTCPRWWRCWAVASVALGND